jgi:imidazoleglycerol-phosphate dehydratase/histidinol-phosphatase
MRPILFIDRDGTIVSETEDEFVDQIEKLHFLPDVLYYLRKIQQESHFLLVLVSNQDGLGTEGHQEKRFYPIHNLIMRTLTSQGIHFDRVHIDEHYESSDHENRKPETGMLSAYLRGNYDIAKSYVIGDRKTDMELADNLGCEGIHISKEKNQGVALAATSWKDIYEFLVVKSRRSMVIRKTNETDISIELNLDGAGKTDISTGLHFFDHMLDQLGKHGGMDLKIQVTGDLQIDEHHTIEDTGLALGEAMVKALGSKKGINRYGFLLPMDDAMAQVAVDFGGRPWMEWNCIFKRERVGDVPTEMIYHFFKSFSDASKCNLNIKVTGENEHHMIEGIFKAFAKAIKMAIKKDPEALNKLPSTKGVL